jgi:hypothetical protein
MDDHATLDRRSLLAALAGVTITVTACDSNGASPTGATGASTGAKEGVVSDNHGHVALIRGPQLAAAQALDLDIHGTADHTHGVALSDGEVRRIRDGERVSKTASLTLGHRHTVTFN